jgi:hypothetical protein
MTTLAMKHPGELTLRRFLAEEPLDAETTDHLRGCAECTARLGKLKEEQRQFEAEIPFERFATGVEKAARVQQRRAPSSTMVRVVIALAACFVAFFAGRQVLEEGAGGNRIKGGGAVDFVIAGPAGQRPAAELEQLASGERVRIGVSGYRHVVALSIDDGGEVSTVYAETLPGEAQTWLPDSIEFTGKGREHLVVVLSDAPVGAEVLAAQLRERFKAAAGDVTKLGALEVPGVQVHRTFLKP